MLATEPHSLRSSSLSKSVKGLKVALMSTMAAVTGIVANAFIAN